MLFHSLIFICSAGNNLAPISAYSVKKQWRKAQLPNCPHTVIYTRIFLPITYVYIAQHHYAFSFRLSNHVYSTITFVIRLIFSLYKLNRVQFGVILVTIPFKTNSLTMALMIKKKVC